jgi:hypothetical protein
VLASIFLTGAGFELSSLKTIDAYADRETVADLYAVGQALGREPKFFGETIIVTAHKTKGDPPVRFPDAIYGGEQYYKSTWPMIDKIKRAGVENAMARLLPGNPKPSEAQRVMQVENASLEAQKAAIEAEQQAIQAEKAAIATKLDDTRRALERATADVRQKSLQIEEMAFLLDSYDRKLKAAASVLRPANRPAVSKGTDQKALLLYRLLSPARIRFLAEQGKLPDQTKWTRQLVRHPLRISEWRGLKRLLRRLERGEYRAEIEREFPHNSE